MEFNIVEKLLAITLLGSEWVLWLLLVCSVISVAVIFERIFFLYQVRISFPEFTKTLLEKMDAQDWDSLLAFCKKSQSIESQVALKGIESRDKGAKAMENHMAGLMVGERKQLDQGLVILGTLGNNAPFIGLFGTVIGIIQAFHDLASNPAGGPSVVMAGISEALVATAVGLIVAIPAVIAYNFFQRSIKTRVANAEAIKKLIVAHFSS